MFSHKKIFVTKNFQSNKFVSQKIILVKKNFSQKNFSHKILLLTKFYQSKKNFVKKNFSQNFFQSQRNFSHKIFVVTKKSQSQKSLVTIYFLVKKFLYSLTHSLTHNNLKVTFSQKWTDQPIDRRTNQPTTRLRELLRAAKKNPEHF